MARTGLFPHWPVRELRFPALASALFEFPAL
eukprot:COSAG06_NODE_50587_length_317_cov_1.788991_1_plen_30_part_10